MLSRNLRGSLAVRWLLGGLLCLALAGGAAASRPASIAHDGATSISFRAPEFPLAALETTSSIRFEKQARSVRLTLQKPTRSACLSWAARTYCVSPRPRLSYTSPALPRRLLLSRQMIPRGPNDAGDPFLASSSLS